MQKSNGAESLHLVDAPALFVEAKLKVVWTGVRFSPSPPKGIMYKIVARVGNDVRIVATGKSEKKLLKRASHIARKNKHWKVFVTKVSADNNLFL